MGLSFDLIMELRIKYVKWRRGDCLLSVFNGILVFSPFIYFLLSSKAFGTLKDTCLITSSSVLSSATDKSYGSNLYSSVSYH